MAAMAGSLLVGGDEAAHEPALQKDRDDQRRGEHDQIGGHGDIPDRRRAEELLRLGQAKLARKGCQLLVVNDVSGGRVFGSDDTRITILGADGVVADIAGDKNLAAHAILDAALGVREREETR